MPVSSYCEPWHGHMYLHRGGGRAAESQREARGWEKGGAGGGRISWRGVCVARDALVLRTVPRDDAAQVRAHGVERIGLKCAVWLDNQIVRIALQALHQLAPTRLVRIQPALEGHVVADRVLRHETAAAASGTGRVEVVQEGAAQGAHGGCDGPEEDQVHQVALLLVPRVAEEEDDDDDDEEKE